MQHIDAQDIAGAQRALDQDGLLVLTDAISAAEASAFAARILAAPERGPGVSGHEFVPMLLNLDQSFQQLAGHPSLLALAHYLLGGRTEPADNAFAWPVDDQIRLCNFDGLIAHPGCQGGFWHMDSPMGQLNPRRQLPDFASAINFIWILTPFSPFTGGTRVVMGSEKRRQLPPATRDSLPGELSTEAPPGSVLVVPNTVWHSAGSNQSLSPRIGLACVYQPWWLGRLTMDSYPVRPDVWETLDPPIQALTKHQLTWNTDFRGELHQS